MEKFKIGPHNLSLEYNYRAIKEYEKQTDESYLSIMQDLGEGTPRLTSIIALVYAGMIGADPNTPHTIDQVATWTMAMNQDDLSKVFIHFVQSFPQVQNKGKEEQPIPDTKKK